MNMVYKRFICKAVSIHLVAITFLAKKKVFLSIILM